MKLQENITSTMREITKQIKESNKVDPSMQHKINTLNSSVNSVVNISPDDITLEENIRHKVDENSSEFEKLCESIKKFGLLKNIVAELKISENNDSYKLVCIAGHRRLTALKKLGMKNKIPCLIKQYSQGDKIGAALSENLNREGLNCVDIADGYKKLIDNKWTKEEIAQNFEKDKKTIAKYLRLAELPKDIEDTFRNNCETFTTRVIFNDVLAKNKAVHEIRKATQRKLDKKQKIKKPAKLELHEKLENFFHQHEISPEKKEAILMAFKYVGLIK